MHHRLLAISLVVGVLAACSGATTPLTAGDGGSGTEGGGATDGGGGGDAHVRTGTCGGSLAGGDLGATISFELAATGSFCTGVPGTCDPTWLTIIDSAGKSLTYGNACETTCGECQQVGCPSICPQPSPVPAEGAKLSWDGRIFTSNTCNGAAGSLSCVDLDCAPSGQYIARMCGYRSTADGGTNACSGLTMDAKPTCVDVPFEWPKTVTVRGTLGP